MEAAFTGWQWGGALAVLVLAAGAATAADWKLVWADEFDSAGAPDQTKWDYERGFIRNRELQYYTDRPANVRVEDGALVLEARRERLANAADDPKAPNEKWQAARPFAEYTSACVITRGKASWRHARVEVRAKVPTGRGLWPAIWMLGVNIPKVGWPACGEIDIMENVGFDPDKIHANIHVTKYNHARGTGRGASLRVPRPHEDFHVYAVEWDAARMDFFVDEQKYFTYSNEGTGADVWPFDGEFYLLLNVAVGGSWGGAKGVDESAFPQRMLVDYVRVYQRPGAASRPATEPATAPAAAPPPARRP